MLYVNLTSKHFFCKTQLQLFRCTNLFGKSSTPIFSFSLSTDQLQHLSLILSVSEMEGDIIIGLSYLIFFPSHLLEEG